MLFTALVFMSCAGNAMERETVSVSGEAVYSRIDPFSSPLLQKTDQSFLTGIYDTGFSR